jgi:hypothetical protein
MTAIAGSLVEFSIDNTPLSVAADSDGERDIGGKSNEDKPTGSGGVIRVQTRKPWMFGGVNVVCDDSGQVQEFLQGIADAGVDVPCRFQMASGVIYQGSGCITGDIKYSSQNGTCQIQLSGPGTLQQQT